MRGLCTTAAHPHATGVAVYPALLVVFCKKPPLVKIEKAVFSVVTDELKKKIR